MYNQEKYLKKRQSGQHSVASSSSAIADVVLALVDVFVFARNGKTAEYILCINIVYL